MIPFFDLINIEPIFYNILIYVPKRYLNNMKLVCNKTKKLINELPKCVNCNALITCYRNDQKTTNFNYTFLTDNSIIYNYFPDHIGPIYGHNLFLPTLECMICQKFICRSCGEKSP